MGLQWPATGLRALSVAVHVWDILKEVAINFFTSMVWAQVNKKEETQPLPSTENWIKGLLTVAPNTLFQHKRRLYAWTSPDDQY